jgi:hypothetical protein
VRTIKTSGIAAFDAPGELMARGMIWCVCVFGFLPIRALAIDTPAGISLLEEQRRIKQDCETKIQTDVLDKLLGKNSASVFVAVQLSQDGPQGRVIVKDLGVTILYDESVIPWDGKSPVPPELRELRDRTVDAMAQYQLMPDQIFFRSSQFHHDSTWPLGILPTIILFGVYIISLIASFRLGQLTKISNCKT